MLEGKAGGGCEHLKRSAMAAPWAPHRSTLSCSSAWGWRRGDKNSGPNYIVRRLPLGADTASNGGPASTASRPRLESGFKVRARPARVGSTAPAIFGSRWRQPAALAGPGVLPDPFRVAPRQQRNLHPAARSVSAAPRPRRRLATEAAIRVRPSTPPRAGRTGPRQCRMPGRERNWRRSGRRVRLAVRRTPPRRCWPAHDTVALERWPRSWKRSESGPAWCRSSARMQPCGGCYPSDRCGPWRRMV
jgi:hypothetical protein